MALSAGACVPQHRGPAGPAEHRLSLLHGAAVLPGFNDLATRDPAVAAQWHPTLNGALGPQDVTLGSSRKVWWLCPDGHVWKAVISSRTGPQHCGCPVCAGKRRPPRRTEEPL